MTGFHLSLPLLKMMLGRSVGFAADLEYFDPDAYKNMKWLVGNDNVDALGLDFTVTEKLPTGSCRTVELIPGGEAIDVIDANKHEHVERRFKHMLFESVSDQLFAFLKGLYEIVPNKVLMLFYAEELDYILSGSDEIDVDDWEANPIMSKNLWGHPTSSDFWKVVRELSVDERRRLLQFAAGSTRASWWIRFAHQ